MMINMMILYFTMKTMKMAEKRKIYELV